MLVFDGQVDGRLDVRIYILPKLEDFGDEILLSGGECNTPYIL